MRNLRIFNSGQFRIHQYENTLRKLYCCNANIYFTRQCIQQKLTPIYTNIKIPSSSPAAKHTLRKVQTVFIEDKLRFLHIKKQQLNHKLHLSLANISGKLWPYIHEWTEDNFQKTIKSKNGTLYSKLLRLTQQQTTTPKNPPLLPQGGQ